AKMGDLSLAGVNTNPRFDKDRTAWLYSTDLREILSFEGTPAIIPIICENLWFLFSYCNLLAL
ncbi:MAG: hypothetical protein JW969_02960, partial [Spirochaetales bacterium]|nr:hypothetical protein [Spirochaetales bacterium]